MANEGYLSLASGAAVPAAGYGLSQDNGYPAGLSHRGHGALGRYAGGSAAAHILDTAAGNLMDELDEMRQRAQAAAIGLAMPEGSTGNILGAGLAAKNAAQLARYTLPIQMEGQAAEAILGRAQAEQAELQNEINRLNFGYLTEPWEGPGVTTVGDPDEPLIRAGGEQAQIQADLDRLYGAVAPAGAPGGAEDPTASAAGPETGDLPLTAQSQAQLAALERRLQRALKFSQVSPQARQDAHELYEQMATLVREDPLAKQALAQENTRFTAGIDVGKTRETSAIEFDKGVRESIIKMTEESLDQATEEFKALAANPDFTRILPNANDPVAIDTWIQDRAHSQLRLRYAELESQLRRMGKDPQKYLAGNRPGAGSGDPDSPTRGGHDYGHSYHSNRPARALGRGPRTEGRCDNSARVGRS